MLLDSKKREIKNHDANQSFKSHNLPTLTSVRTLKRKNDEKSRFREKSLRACEYLSVRVVHRLFLFGGERR